MNNYYLFLLWGSAIKNDRLIEAALIKKFKIKNKILYEWHEELFINNLRRFYFKNNINPYLKIIETSKKKFMVYIVSDKNPDYSNIKLRGKLENINKNIYDMKLLLRKQTNGGHKIHSSNTTEEFQENMRMLNIYNQKLPKFSYQNLNPPGTNSWNTIEESLIFLGDFLNYVVMRGVDNIYKLNKKNINDIDLLVEDKKKAALVLNAAKINKIIYKSAYIIKVKNNYINIDIRDINDGYYDKKWIKNIFINKIKYKNIFIPSKNDYKNMLVYHSLIHKYEIPNKYKSIINHKTLNSFQSFMEKNKYSYTEPKDLSVAYNLKQLNISNPTSKIRKIYLHIRYYKDILYYLKGINLIMIIRKIYAAIFKK